ncbi:Aryl-phospho-beta-D-glucosidase BglH [bioreactor metagenome]|uniref:Glycoside hydrolase n=2 Tax=root TaxID=1 RepID=R9CB48_9CLOT|nr:glycoside hydrolase family 1 protein [Clostridium sartagoforme]EOR26493.1 glycoside hydrolase [Clostridium sartagoforme AAU1]
MTGFKRKNGMKMPEGFLWGGSVSAHQTEGASGEEYGKGLTIYDYLKSKGFRDFNDGIDFYHNYEDDIKLFKELGINSYRFSVAWSRILPDGEGEINEQGLRFYDRVIDSLLDNQIEPMICLYHFDTPLELQNKYDGWLGRGTLRAYEKYVRILMERYKGKVKYWIPMNEHNGCPLVGLLASEIGPDDSKFDSTRYQLMHNMALASAIVVKCKNEIDPDATVIGMINSSPCYPKTCNPLDILEAQRINESFNFDLLNILVRGQYSKALWRSMDINNLLPNIEDNDLELLKKNTVDCIGISYYASSIASNEKRGINVSRNTLNTFMGKKTAFDKNPYLENTEWGWTIDPLGLRIILKDIYQRYEKPIYILESGIGVNEELDKNMTVEDDYRIEYFKKQIEAVSSSICEDFVDVRSFLTWAPIDILSSQGEMKKRYGFIYVNRTDTDLRDMKRYKKKSFKWFHDVIKSNGEEL